MVLAGCRWMGKLCAKKQNWGEKRKLNLHLAEKLFQYLFSFQSKMKTRTVETSQKTQPAPINQTLILLKQK